MEELFLTILNRGLAAGWLVLAVLLLRALLHRAPKNVRVLLWGLVAVRLLLPVSVKSPFSLLPSAQTLPRAALTAAVPAIESGVPALDAAVNPAMAASLAPSELASVNPLQVWLTVGSLVWLAGLAAMLLYMLLSTLRLRRRVAGAVFLHDRLWLCDRIDTPFVLGLFRPRIYLPYGLDEETMALVLAHEQGHITRHDHCFKPFAFLLLAVWWFQPLLWLGYALFCRDLELACDEHALSLLGREARKPYARALVSVGAGGHIAACPVAFGESGVKGRVKNALRFRPASGRLLWLLVPLLALLALLFLTDPGTELARGAAVERIEVFDGSTGRALTIENPDEVARLTALMRELEPKRGGLSLGYTGYRFRITLQPSGERFILNAPDTLRKDPFFYTVEDNGLYAALEALYPPLQPAPPEGAPFVPEALPEEDAAALLLRFAEAQVLTVYDGVGRSYFPLPLRFEDLVAGESWTVEAQMTEFPASAPDRLVELLSDGQVLRIEDDGSGDLLYMIYDADWDWGDPVLYLGGGDGLMDDWMAWASARQAG